MEIDWEIKPPSSKNICQNPAKYFYCSREGNFVWAQCSDHCLRLVRSMRSVSYEEFVVLSVMIS